MSHIDLGTTGAKRATWRETDARPLLAEIVRTNPSLSDDGLFKLLWNEIKDSEDHIQACVRYWFDLAIRALRPRPHDDEQRRRAAKAEREAVATAKVALKKRIEHEAKIVLLDLIMPNGKPLRECTGTDCRKFGGWCALLAKCVPPRKTVEETLSEEQVFGLWQQAQKK